MNKDTNIKIKSLLDKNEVCLFMKGTPEVPQCGFSLAVSNVLKYLLQLEKSHIEEHQEFLS